MSDYFADPGPHTPNTQARAEDVNDRFDAVAAGLELLPDPLTNVPGIKGFSQPTAVGDPVDDRHAVPLSHLNEALSDSIAANPVVVVAGATRDLADEDHNQYLRFTAAGQKTASVRLQSVHALRDGWQAHIRNADTGDVVLSGASGVTITPPSGGSLAVPLGGTVTIKKVSDDAFDLFGVTVAE